MSPVAGRMRPNTIASGILSTKRSSPVSTSRFTRMLVPNPKKAFQSPGVHQLGVFVVIVVGVIVASSRAASSRVESVTHPKIPPWAVIMRRPTSWNSGKYEPQQSPGTMHRYPRSFASRTVVCTQTSVVTPHTISVSMSRFWRMPCRSVA